MKLHAQNFAVGMKVSITIPVSNAKKFSDWAVINEIDGNQIVVQLSRSVLPEGVTLRVGQVIECRNLNDKNGFSYQAIVAHKGVLQELRLNLFHEISSSDRREFFRIDAFLPLQCHINPGKRTYSVLKQWKVRLKQFKAEEEAHKKALLEEARHKHNQATGSDSAAQAYYDKKRRSDFVPYDPSWDHVLPQAVNISGGGISLFTNHRFDIDEFVLLELFIPSRHRVLAIVAQVLFAHRTGPAGTEQGEYNTSMQFIYIEEQDRSAIIHYISLMQSKRLRQINDLADLPLYKEPDESEAEKDFDLDDNYSFARRVKASTPFNWAGLALVIITFAVSCSCASIVLKLITFLRSPASAIGDNIGNNVEKFRSTYQKKQ